jgi:hypothetical protein
MACGQPATMHKSKNFAWYPKWTLVLILAHVLIFAIVASILTKRMRVDVPLCEKHRGYFWKRTLLMILSFVLLVAVGIGVVALLSDQLGGDAAGFACIGFGVLLLIWVIALIIIQQMMIRPSEISERSITLVGVNDDFVAAFEEMKTHDDFDDEFNAGFDNREPRRKRRRDYDDDEPRKPRDRRTDIRAAEPDDRIQGSEE